jgi:hypothetical protein
MTNGKCGSIGGIILRATAAAWFLWVQPESVAVLLVDDGTEWVLVSDRHVPLC